MKSALSALLFAACIIGATQAVAQGNTWYISPYGNNSNNGTVPQDPFLTLRAALDAASPGDTIEAASGVYSGSDNIDLTLGFDVTLEGKSEGSTIFQSTVDENMYRIATANVVFSKVTLVGVSDSSAAGVDVAAGAGFAADSVTFSSLYYGIYYSAWAAAAEVSDCTFLASTNFGVMVYADSSSTVTLPSMSVSDSLFQSRYGVYVDMYSSSASSDWDELSVSGCVFQASSLVVKDGWGPETLTVSDSQFSNLNTVSTYSAIYLDAYVSEVVLTGVSVSHTTTTQAAAVYVTSASSSFSGSLTMTDCWVSFSNAGGYPSGVYTEAYDVTVTNSGFVGNVGEALSVQPYYSTTARAVISNTVFFGNDASATATGTVELTNLPVASSISDSYFIQNRGASGGALYVDDSVVDVTGSYFYDNEATADGGAIFVNYGGNVTASYSAFGGNTAVNGGAVAADGSSGLSFRSTSFSANVASGNGGAAYGESTSRLTALLCSFSGNEAANGGGFYSSSSSVNGEVVLIRGNNATVSGGGFACYDNGVSILNGWISNNAAPVGPAYSCSGECNTYLTHVYVASNNAGSGCSNDFVADPLLAVEAAVEKELSALPALDMAYILALIEEKTSA